MGGPGNRRRVMVLGLDGVPWELLNSLVRRGRLGTFQALLQGSARGTMESTLPPATGPAWTSFATGVNPGKHGVFGLYHHWREGEPRPVTSEDIRVDTLPQILTQQGFRSIFINLPVSHPPRPFNGILLADILAPHPSIYPDAMARYLDGYRIFFDRSLTGRALVEDIIEVERQRLSVARRLLEEQPWDLFFLLISGTDWLSHFCYGEMLHAGRLGERALGLFDEIEGFLAWLRSKLGPGVALFLLSDHGFQVCDRVLDLNAWLRSRGYATRRTRPSGEVGPRMREADVVRRTMTVRPWLISMARHFPRLKALGLLMVRGRNDRVALRSPYSVDLPRSKAFAGSGHPFAIFVNRTLIPGEAQYDTLVAGLVQDLKELRDPFNEGPAFRLVLPRDEAYFGDNLEPAPDILFVGQRGLLVSGNFLPEEGFALARGNYHSMEGFLVMEGAGIRPGVDLGTVKLWDIAPTILRVLGGVVPPWMDGKPLEGALLPTEGSPLGP